MAYRQYIGARYVPIFDGTWDATKNYEPLTIVDDANGNSYTSKKDVPAGTALTNREYWALTSSFSGAVESLNRRMDTAETEIDGLETTVEELNGKVETAETDISSLSEKVLKLDGLYVKPEDFGAVGDGVTDDHTALQAAIDTGKTVYGFAKYYSSQPLNIASHGQTVVFDGELIFSGTGIVLSNTTRLNLFVRHLIGSGTGYGIYLHKYSADGGRRLISFCKIQGVEISNFAKGIYCHVEQDSTIGIQYNTFDFLRIFNTEVAIEYLVNGTGNWCTQQKFSNMRLEVCTIGVKLVSNSDVSNNNVFENVGFESPSYECITLKNVSCSAFNNIRLAENLSTSYYINMEDCKNITYNGDIILGLTKIRDVQNNPVDQPFAALSNNYYECERIDTEPSGGWRATKMITNNGAVWYLDQFNAQTQVEVINSTHTLGVTAPASDGAYYRLQANAGNAATLIIPYGLIPKVNMLWINVSHAGGTEIVKNSAGDTLIDLSSYEAGSYLLVRYGARFKAIKS